MTSVGRLFNFPPIPEMPEPFRGKSFAVIEVIYCGDPADGEGLVAPLRELGTVGMDTMAQPPAGIAQLHMDPPDPVPYASASLLTSELPAAAIDSMLEAVGPGSDSQLLLVDLRHAAGALSYAPEGAGALSSLPGAFLAFGAGFVPVPEAMVPTRTWLGAFKASLEPYVAGNYLSFVEEPFDITRVFPPDILDAFARSSSATTATTSSIPTIRSRPRIRYGLQLSCHVLDQFRAPMELCGSVLKQHDPPFAVLLFGYDCLVRVGLGVDGTLARRDESGDGPQDRGRCAYRPHRLDLHGIATGLMIGEDARHFGANPLLARAHTAVESDDHAVVRERRCHRLTVVSVPAGDQLLVQGIDVVVAHGAHDALSASRCP
jgi:hypothetical protein